MDITDIASNYEAIERAANIDAARRPISSAIGTKRRTLAEARQIAAQRGVDDPEVQALDLQCHNGCEEPLSIENEDVFCCKECATDWERRDRAARINGRSFD
jgi:hypothetical protein